MEIYSPTLFIEVNNLDYVFAVGDYDENNNHKIIYKNIVPIQGIENKKIINFDLAFNIIKKNIYLIEHKLNFIFKDAILIIDNFNLSYTNLSGFKKLNGSQILKENITYILNSLKSSINKFEEQKTILHIFNSKYCLDKKKIENLPIGLFGDFYSHELSFCLINNNDFKNLNNIFRKSNLKIKKILLKSFIMGVYLSKENQDIDTFFQVILNEKNSQIFYFENDSLKFEQKFDFGSDLILNDIAKIISLDKDIVKKILTNFKFNRYMTDDEFVEKELFKNINYRKIKKKLIFEIAEARIQELSELIITKNINFSNSIKKNGTIFFQINDKSNFECFKESFTLFFSKNHHLLFKFTNKISIEDLIKNTNNLVNYGWKKEAVPVIQIKKSLIARIFESIFS